MPFRVPNLTAWRNEIVQILGLVGSVIAFITMTLADVDLDSITSILAVIPAIAANVGSNYAYGRQSVEELLAAERARGSN